MPGKIFLHGGGSNEENIRKCIQSFIKGKSKICVLFAKTPPSLMQRIKNTWLSLKGNRSIYFIVPKGTNVSPNDVQKIKNSDAVFINGGDTKEYYKYYTPPALKRAISDCYAKGGHIGGSSAGALLISAYCALDGNTIKAKGHNFLVASPCSSNTSNAALVIKRGLAITNMVLDVHLTQQGRLPRLMAVMEQKKSDYGIGIDEDTYLVLANNKIAVKGLGRVFLIKKERNTSFSIRTHSPNSSQSISDI